MEQIALGALGLVGTILVVVVKPLFGLLKANTKATAANTAALQNIAKETKRGADEAKQRNGHLAELIINSRDDVQSIADNAVTTIVGAVQNVKEQHVDVQHVEHGTVIKEQETKE